MQNFLNNIAAVNNPAVRYVSRVGGQQPRPLHFQPRPLMGEQKKGTTKVMKKKVMKKKAMKKRPMKKRLMKMMKRRSTIARGKRAKCAVARGRKRKTTGGLKKSDIIKNKSGKFVSKRASLASKVPSKSKHIHAWGEAVKKARQALGVNRQFVPCGGTTEIGQKLLKLARSFHVKPTNNYGQAAAQDPPVDRAAAQDTNGPSDMANAHTKWDSVAKKEEMAPYCAGDVGGSYICR